MEALDLQRKTATGETVRIISVGRLTAKKGFDDALRAIFILRQLFEDFRYTIVGEGPQHAMLKSMIHNYKLSANVDMLGALPSDKTLATIAGSDILLAPSKTAASGDREGIPNVIKEAMFLGLQIITTRHSGIPELVKHGRNGFLVSENNPEEIAETLHKIIQDRHEWPARSERARELICNEYTPGKTTEALIEAYESIL
jgi:colanic acid/amylovoran biosynthesis glycosyltransferase